MRRLTTFIAVIFAAAAFAPLRAQSLDAFKERLAAPGGPPTLRSARPGSPLPSTAMRRRLSTTLRAEGSAALRGYRVCIFFDNGQDARAGAFAAEALFKETYPGSWYTRCTRIPISRSRWETA